MLYKKWWGVVATTAEVKCLTTRRAGLKTMSQIQQLRVLWLYLKHSKKRRTPTTPVFSNKLNRFPTPQLMRLHKKSRTSRLLYQMFLGQGEQKKEEKKEEGEQVAEIQLPDWPIFMP
eukprot:g1609.t1